MRITPDDSPPRLPERIEGDRLLLRRWTLDDVDLLSLAVEANLEHLRPWMPWIAAEPLTKEQRLELERRWEQDWLKGGDVGFAILLAGQVAGGCGLHRRRGPTGLEIGYWVDKDHLRQGIATEAVAMLTTAAFSVPNIAFVEIHHDKANIASAMVPRRLGYRFMGESKDVVTAPGEVGIDCRWRISTSRWHLLMGE